MPDARVVLVIISRTSLWYQAAFKSLAEILAAARAAHGQSNPLSPGLIVQMV